MTGTHHMMQKLSAQVFLAGVVSLLVKSTEMEEVLFLCVTESAAKFHEISSAILKNMFWPAKNVFEIFES